MVFRRSLEMSLTREEFFRLLPGAVAPYATDGEMVRWSEKGHAGTIRLVPLESRRLGSVEMARHRVEIALEGTSEPEGETFMARFHRAFLRGGG